MTRNLLGCLICLTMTVSCTEESTKNDSRAADQGRAKDGSAKDGAIADRVGATPDGLTKNDGLVFSREVTLGYDDGLPAVALSSDPLSKGHLIVSPEKKLLPAQIRKIQFIPASAYTATLSIETEGTGGTPGTQLGSKAFATTAADVDRWFTVDISDLKLVVNGPFWVTVTYPATLAGAQKVLYGGGSSSGNNYYGKSGYPLYTVNFDQLLRVVIATANQDTPVAPGSDGAPCTAGVDCASGYCSGARCSVTCPSAGCGTGRRCQDFLIGQKVCVTECTKNSDCAAEAFCLLDGTFLKPGGFCVRGGPFADGKACTNQYHTICKSGHCSACDQDPSKCQDTGACQPKP
jgi:hypothetical protein